MKNIALILSVIGLAVCPACNQKNSKTAEANGTENAHVKNTIEGFPDFDPNNLKTYEGRILEIVTLMDPYNQSSEVGIVIQTEKGDIPVQLGPGSFVLGGPVSLTPNQNVEVTGSELNIEGQLFIIAQEVKINGYVLKLRDKQGNPLWTGWKKN